MGFFCALDFHNLRFVSDFDIRISDLPAGFLYTWNVALERLFAEADAAKVEITHKAARTAALETTPNRTRRKLRHAVRLNYH